jgi:hypothetical protein
MPEFRHADLKLLNPSFDSSLVDVLTAGAAAPPADRRQHASAGFSPAQANLPHA